MGALWDEVIRRESLLSAWENVLSNDAEDGRLGGAVRRFNDRIEDEIGRIETDLRYGVYHPGPLTEVAIVVDDDVRMLQVPSVRDRVVERSVLSAVTPFVDPVLGPWSFAYRPGLGVSDAIAAVVDLREEGLPWVLRTDIEECFPSIPVDRARRDLGALIDDEDVLHLVDLLLDRPVRDQSGRQSPVRGLPQGISLAPLLANLVLVALDEEISAAGYPLVRYADDILVAAPSPEGAREASRIARTTLRRMGMDLNAEKTRVMSFDEGFAFLGEDFGPRYPPAGIDQPREPDRKTLYVAVQGGRVRVQAGRVVVESPDDATLLDVPQTQVSRLVTFGSVGVSAGLRSLALADGMDVVFASRRGGYLGTMLGLRDQPKAERLRAQLAFANRPAGLALARSIVEAKIRKQSVVLRRFAREEHAEQVADAVRQLQALPKMLPDAMSRAEVMGLEGAGARVYWPCYGALMPDDLRFQNRSRQPPMDLANSALSFLYTVLLGECVTACASAGLHPTFGVLHGDEDRRPSLALDLIEEFRPWIVDQIVLRAARGRHLTGQHARTEPGKSGVYLTAAGREAVLEAYETRMLTTTKGALPGIAGSLRRHVYAQAHRMALTISNPATPWTGASWR